MNTTIEVIDYKGKKNTFQIVTPGRTYVMQGSSDADVDHWVKCLKEAQNPKGKTVVPIQQTPINAADSDEESVRPCFSPRSPLLGRFSLL